MRYVAVLVAGLILLALGAQGALRLVFGTDPGVLSGIPGGSGIQLAVYVALAIAGTALAAWGRDQAKRRGDLG